MKNATYLVYYYISEYDTFTAYVDAPSAREAVDSLGIPEDDVIEVARIIKDWKKSAQIKKYTLVDADGHVTAYRATSERNALDRARRTFGGVWRVLDIENNL